MADLRKAAEGLLETSKRVLNADVRQLSPLLMLLHMKCIDLERALQKASEPEPATVPVEARAPSNGNGAKVSRSGC